MKTNIQVVFGGNSYNGITDYPKPILCPGEMKEEGIYEFKKQMLELNAELGTIEDIKNIILDKLDRDEETNEIELFSESNLLKGDEKADLLNDGRALMAVIDKIDVS